MSFPRAANNRDASASYSLASTLTSLLSDAAAQRCEESLARAEETTHDFGLDRFFLWAAGPGVQVASASMTPSEYLRMVVALLLRQV